MPQPKICKKQSIHLNLDPGIYMFCTCGESTEQPFCDGKHTGTDFQPKRFKLSEPTSVSLCLCKHAKTLPYCDGTHREL